MDHRSIVINFPLGALAHLVLARSYALAGDTAKARAEYQRLSCTVEKRRSGHSHPA
jgi:hypothetical protein